MKRSNHAWLLFPIVIAGIVIVGLLVSNYQKEMGIAEPSEGGRAAVAATFAALELSRGTSPDAYKTFSDALLVAAVAKRNMAIINVADTRLDHQLTKVFDCLYAAREAWQAQVDQTWDDAVHGTAVYWQTMHPAIGAAGDRLTAPGVRESSVARASETLEEAARLVAD
ncbi:MAG: hypothetical protein JW990_00010 [Thermoleophilia bacterium]|nr:hypothetical protein [Thermoleophilia bacterium]